MCGSTVPNAISTSGLAAAPAAISSIGTGGTPIVVARVDGEDDGSHLPLAVVLRHLADRRPVPIDHAEVLVGRLLELRRQRAAPGDARHLDMGVHVDGDERVDIDRAHARDRSNPGTVCFRRPVRFI